MQHQFSLGDTVEHNFSKEVGKVVGLRVAEPYTVKVKWDGDARVEKDWYKPEVLVAHEKAVSQFRVDSDNNDEEHFYVDIAGKGSVCIISNKDGVSVDIYPLQVADNPIASMYVLNEDFEEEE